MSPEDRLEIHVSIGRDRSELRINYKDQETWVLYERPDRVKWQDARGRVRTARVSLDGETNVVDGSVMDLKAFEQLVTDGLRLRHLRQEDVCAAYLLWSHTTAQHWLLRRPDVIRDASIVKARTGADAELG